MASFDTTVRQINVWKCLSEKKQLWNSYALVKKVLNIGGSLSLPKKIRAIYLIWYPFYRCCRHWCFICVAATRSATWQQLNFISVKWQNVLLERFAFAWNALRYHDIKAWPGYPIDRWSRRFAEPSPMSIASQPHVLNSYPHFRQALLLK